VTRLTEIENPAAGLCLTGDRWMSLVRSGLVLLVCWGAFPVIGW
jgi:hypothetical protein